MLTNLKEKIFIAGQYNGLQVIDGWSMPVYGREKVGEYKDSSGNALTGVFKQKINDKTTRIIIINKGFEIYDYHLPSKLKYSPVNSPMISWKNLYYHQKTYVLSRENNTPLGKNLTALFAIIEGSKPSSTFYIYSDMQLGKSIQMMKKFDIDYKIHRKDAGVNENTTYLVNAAKKGYIHEYIDVNNYISLLYDYAKTAEFDFFKMVDISTVCTMLDRPIVEIMEEFDYHNESYSELVVVTGLCLGFPPEVIIGYLMKDSTQLRMNKQRKYIDTHLIG